LDIQVFASKHTLELNISQIDTLHIQEIKKSLSNFLYYFIMIGYEIKEEFRLISADQFYLFKQDIIIDGETIYGTNKHKVEWLSLLKE